MLDDTTRFTWAVCFDVSDDRRRVLLSRFLESVGLRVQYSVFEVVATRAHLDEVLSLATAPERFDPAEDSLRCYRLCASCRGESVVHGLAVAPVGAGTPLVI